jgi:hypothetical protein
MHLVWHFSPPFQDAVFSRTLWILDMNVVMKVPCQLCCAQQGKLRSLSVTVDLHRFCVIES